MFKIKDADQAGNACAFTAGDDQPGEIAEISGCLDPPALNADAPEMVKMFKDIALKIQDADGCSLRDLLYCVVILSGHFERLPTPSGEQLPFGDFRYFKSGHGLAEPHGGLKNLLRVVEICRCHDDGPGPQGRVCRLEDS